MKKYFSLIVVIAALIFSISASSFYGSFNSAVKPLITPASYTFFIWGVIFPWLVIATFLQWRDHRKEKAWEGLRWPLLISMLAGIFWSPSVSIDAFLSLAIILIMWAAASYALVESPTVDPWVGIYPIGFYAGWLSVACGVSLGTLLVDMGILSDLFAALVGIVVAGLLAGILIIRVPLALSVSAAVIWALLGIIVRNIGGDGSMIVLGAAVVGAGIIGVYGFRQCRATIISAKRRREQILNGAGAHRY